MLSGIVGTRHQSHFAQMEDIAIALPTDLGDLHQTTENAE